MDKRNDILQFITRYFQEQIKASAYAYLFPTPIMWAWDGISRSDEKGLALLEKTEIKGIERLKLDEDELEFDVVVHCGVAVLASKMDGIPFESIKRELYLRCSITITEHVGDLVIHLMENYDKQENDSKSASSVTHALVPIIKREQIEDEATRFLERYCPEALTTPMAVPIEKIIRERMGLYIIEGKRLSEDFSIFGQICFLDGIVGVIDASTGVHRNIHVKQGTVLIDCDAVYKRNIGSMRYTLAHEAFHWYRHRAYAFLQKAISEKTVVRLISRRRKMKGQMLVPVISNGRQMRARHEY